MRADCVGDTAYARDKKHTRKKTASFWLRFVNALQNTPAQRSLSEHPPIVLAGAAESLSGG